MNDSSGSAPIQTSGQSQNQPLERERMRVARGTEVYNADLPPVLARGTTLTQDLIDMALAQFRILQALNQFAEDGGWVACVAPTRALVAQILRRLRRDFSPLGIKVEQVSGGIEIDSFEDEILGQERGFDVLISTPEKLGLIIRNRKLAHRPLALVVVDEAHNIEDQDRGLRIELLQATMRQECSEAN